MTGSRRLEIALVALIVLGGAFYARSVAIPPFPERHVDKAAQKYDLDLGEPNRWFSAWSVGDGQAFAVIAAGPTGVKLSEEIKEPAYRFSRAGYGWLGYIASLGQERWIPYALALVGALAVLGNLVFAVWLRTRLGPSSWLLVLNPALYIGFASDTAEPLAVLLLTWGLASGTTGAAVALGVTRPSYLVALVRRTRLFWIGIAGAVALLVYSVIRFGTEELIPDGGRLDIPLRAYIENPSPAGWLLAFAALATLVVGAVRKDWAWVISGLLVLSLGSDVTENIENAWRAAGMLPVLWAFGVRPAAKSDRQEHTQGS